jgi:hypothetical protein
LRGDRDDGVRQVARAPGADLAAEELLHVVMLPDFDRADRIGEFWGHRETRTFGELLIDCEEDRTLRAVMGMLRETDRGRQLPILAGDERMREATSGP